MIRKRLQNVHPSRHKSTGLLLGLLQVGLLLLPAHSHAQDVAFSLSQQVVGDTLEVTLSGQSLDAQPDELMGFVLEFSSSSCLDITGAKKYDDLALSAQGYAIRLHAVATGFRLSVMKSEHSATFLTLPSTSDVILRLGIPFDQSTCASPGVNLTQSNEDHVLDLNAQLLTK